VRLLSRVLTSKSWSVDGSASDPVLSTYPAYGFVHEVCIRASRAGADWAPPAPASWTGTGAYRTAKGSATNRPTTATLTTHRHPRLIASRYVGRLCASTSVVGPRGGVSDS